MSSNSPRPPARHPGDRLNNKASPKGDDYPPVLRLSLPNLHLNPTEIAQFSSQQTTTTTQSSSASPAIIRRVFLRNDRTSSSQRAALLPLRLCMRYNISPIRTRRQPPPQAAAAETETDTATTAATTNSTEQQATSSSSTIDTLSPTPSSEMERKQLNSNNNTNTNNNNNNQLFDENDNNYFNPPYITSENINHIPPGETLLRGYGIVHQNQMLRNDLTTIERLCTKQPINCHKNENELICPHTDILGDPLAIHYDVKVHQVFNPLSFRSDNSFCSPKTLFIINSIIFGILVFYHLIIMIVTLIYKSYEDCESIPQHLLTTVFTSLTCLLLEWLKTFLLREHHCHLMDTGWHAHSSIEISLAIIMVSLVGLYCFLFIWSIIGISRVSNTFISVAYNKNYYVYPEGKIPSEGYANNDCQTYLRYAMTHTVLLTIILIIRCMIFCTSRICQAAWSTLLLQRNSRSKPDAVSCLTSSHNHLHHHVPPIQSNRLIHNNIQQL